MGKVNSTDHKQALEFVLQKLRKMTLNGYVFGDEGYTFEWDKTKSKGQNLQAVEAEYALLRYLEQVGVITITVIDNYYRTQQRESWADPNRGHIIWGGWEEFHPALREFEWLVYVDAIDNAQYQIELGKLGLHDQGYEIKTAQTKPKSSPKLNTHSYNSKTGVLHINGEDINIVLQNKKLTDAKSESLQGRAMKLLFITVNSMRDGVPLRKIVNSRGVIQDNLKDFQRKQAKNHIAAINNKVKGVNNGRSMIKIDKGRFYIDPELLD